MSQIQIVFNYKCLDTLIQFNQDMKFIDIFKNFKTKTKTEGKFFYFIYNGSVINNAELTFNEIANDDDKKRKKMNILVEENYLDIQSTKSDFNSNIKSKNIICPECKEDIQFNIKNYLITLNDCKNKHKKENIFLDKFDETQIIDISKIICQKCKKYNKAKVHNNIFYKCNTCDINLCPICYSNHDKNHYLINYEDRNFICKKHNNKFTEYCKTCKENICIYCEKEHKSHLLISFGKLIPDEKELNNYLNIIVNKTTKFVDEINSIISKKNVYNINNYIIDKLNQVKTKMGNYYKIIYNIIKNYNKEKINYEILTNIENINKNKEIINDMDNIMNDTNLNNKLNKIIEIYNKMYNKKDETILQNNNNIIFPMDPNFNMNMNMNNEMSMQMLGMMNMMNNNLMLNMNNFDMQMPTMNNMMINQLMLGMNNINMQNPNLMQMNNEEYINDIGKLTLIFDNYWENKKISIKINFEDCFEEAIKRYFAKQGIKEPKNNYKFIYNNKSVRQTLKINENGLRNESTILVIDMSRITG